MRTPRSAPLAAVLLFATAWAAPASAGERAPLPPVARSPTARQVRRSDPRIEKYRQKYLARRLELPSLRKLAEEVRLQRAARKLGARIGASADRRPILVILEGPDGAGKSGTIRRLRTVFDRLGAVREVHFGAPPAGEKRPWLARYRDRLPRAGEVAIWDRSYYGRVVYDPYYKMVDESQVAERYGDIADLEGELARRFRVVKIYLDARGDRLAQTIGKREAVAPEKLEESDYQTFRDRKIIRSLFEKAIDQTGGAVRWHVVPMDDRGEGRFELLDVLRRELLD